MTLAYSPCSIKAGQYSRLADERIGKLVRLRIGRRAIVRNGAQRGEHSESGRKAVGRDALCDMGSNDVRRKREQGVFGTFIIKHL